MEKRLLSRRKVAPARTFPPILWMDVWNAPLTVDRLQVGN
jgi:hypothetical protein